MYLEGGTKGGEGGREGREGKEGREGREEGKEGRGGREAFKMVGLSNSKLGGIHVLCCAPDMGPHDVQLRVHVHAPPQQSCEHACMYMHMLYSTEIELPCSSGKRHLCP